MTKPTHVPVLLDRVVALVAPALDRPGAVFVDATLGLGGHTESVLERCPQAHAVGVDRDQHALELAGARLAPFAGRTTLVHAVYDEIPAVLDELRHRVGRRHPLRPRRLLDAARPAASAGSPTPRTRRSTCAWTTPPARPRPTCSTPTPPPISPGCCGPTARSGSPGRSRGRSSQARETEPFTGSARLVDLLRDTIPAPARRTGGHPAKRTFQALRIEVNDELGVLRPPSRPRSTRSTSAAGSW